jgi:uncharacterized protein (DUF488 family)
MTLPLYTIGFTQKPASRFFDLLREHAVRLLVDIRLNPGGQLAGFAKQDDLQFFLDRLIGCDYRHLPLLAPEPDLLSSYRTDHNWPAYAERFERLMDARGVPQILDRALFEPGPVVLLCSEHAPDNCHRRLVAERLARTWPGLEVVHLR